MLIGWEYIISSQWYPLSNSIQLNQLPFTYLLAFSFLVVLFPSPVTSFGPILPWSHFVQPLWLTGWFELTTILILPSVPPLGHYYSFFPPVAIETGNTLRCICSLFTPTSQLVPPPGEKNGLDKHPDQCQGYSRYFIELRFSEWFFQMSSVFQWKST